MKHHVVGSWKKVLLVSTFIFVVMSGSAMGAGFALIEQGVSGLGNAYAGSSAAAEDASTIYFNPAGLTKAPSQFIAAGYIIIPSAKFTDTAAGSKRVTGAPLGGDNGGDAGGAAFVPNIYYSKKLGDKYAFGLGINVPFGLATEYTRTWVGRYHAVKSEIHALNINPALAFKLTDNLSFGAGLNIQKIDATLTNAVDVTLISGGVFTQDGYANMKGDDLNYGYNLGLLYDFSKSSRIGLAYRSKIKHKLEGDVKFENIPAPVAASPNFQNRSISADATMPDTFSVSVYSKVSPTLSLMADITWTNWSVFKEVRIKSANGASDVVTTYNWQDTLRYSLGMTCTPSDKSSYRIGVAYDETPYSADHYRSPRIPDESRIWISAGYGYKFSQKLSMDLGFAYLFIKNPVLDKTATPTNEDRLRGSLKGAYESDVKIIGAQINYTF